MTNIRVGVEHNLAQENLANIPFEIPNSKTAKIFDHSTKQIKEGDYYRFNSNNEAINFLESELK